MNDFEKAVAVITDRRNSLQEISKKTGIPYVTIRIYSSNLEKLRNAAWSRVYAIAQLYKK